ncbi:MAG: hypothetical protein JWM05_1004 [Acidimicrobiales bacterium]|nr:hypothetical protein [Acidimicrobiales bacterium]
MTSDAARRQSSVCRRRKVAWVTAVALAMGVTACGSRRTGAELSAAARGGGADQPGVSSGPSSAGQGAVSGGAASGSAVPGSPVPGSAVPGSAVPGRAASGGAVATGTGTPGAAATKSAVTIAALGAFSGIVGQSQGPYLNGLRAWIRMVNDQGGLNGHPVNPLIVADDGGDSARNRQLAQQLIERDHVLALAFDTALDGSGTVDYVTKSGVPFVGGYGAGAYFYRSPLYFPQMPQGGALAETNLGLLAEMKARNKTKLATVVCIESPVVCNAEASVLKRAAPRYGAQVVYATTASITAPDYSAECLNARNAGAEVIFMVLDAASTIRLQQSCARQGYHPTFSTKTTTVNADTAANDGFEGMIIPAPTMPLAGNPGALREFRTAMAKYAPGVTVIDGQVESWAAGKVLQLGAAHLPDGDVATLRRALVSGLYAIPRGYDLDFTAPLQFNPGKTATPSLCWFVETIHNHQFVPANGGQRTCAPYDPSLVP